MVRLSLKGLLFQLDLFDQIDDVQGQSLRIVHYSDRRSLDWEHEV
jgi:hypothetical protein